jgi:vacuolar protein sorting-associated protein 13A/C
VFFLIVDQLKGSFDGFRLILIGDLHEQPMLHLKVKPFIVGAKDWSGEVICEHLSLDYRLKSLQLHATTTMATQLSYWNLTNSHWEPCKFVKFSATSTNMRVASDRSLDLHNSGL